MAYRTQDYRPTRRTLLNINAPRASEWRSSVTQLDGGLGVRRGLRDWLFAKTLTVKTAAPLPEPDRVFGGIPTLDNWRLEGPATYVLAVSDTAKAAKASSVPWSQRAPGSYPSPSRAIRWRTCISS